MLQLRDGQLRTCIESARTWRDLVDSVTERGSELEVLILKKELTDFCELVGTRYLCSIIDYLQSSIITFCLYLSCRLTGLYLFHMPRSATLALKTTDLLSLADTGVDECRAAIARALDVRSHGAVAAETVASGDGLRHAIEGTMASFDIELRDALAQRVRNPLQVRHSHSTIPHALEC